MSLFFTLLRGIKIIPATLFGCSAIYDNLYLFNAYVLCGMGLTLWLSLQENQIWAHKTLGPYGLRLIGWNNIFKYILANRQLVVVGCVSVGAAGGTIVVNDNRINNNEYTRDFAEYPKLRRAAWTHYHDTINNCGNDEQGKNIAGREL